MKRSSTVRTFWNEKWAEVIVEGGFANTRYYISNHGRIKSVNKITNDERLLRGSKDPNRGYQTLKIRSASKRNLTIYIHKFVAENFVPKESEDKEFVVHINKDKKNNYYTNLKWLNQKELTQWQMDLGIFKTENKKRHPGNKMTETKVRLLKKRLKEGKTKKKVLAKNFNITLTHLVRIERGQYWGSVTIDE